MKNKTIGLLDSILGNESLETVFESSNPELAEEARLLAAAEAVNNAQTLEFAIEDAIEENEVRQEHGEELEELVEGMEHLLKQPTPDLLTIGLLYNRADKLNVQLSGKSTLPKDGMEGMDAKRLEAYVIVGQEGFMDTIKSGAKATKDFILKLYKMVRDWIKSLFTKSSEPKEIAKDMDKVVDEALERCLKMSDEMNKILDGRSSSPDYLKIEILNPKLNLKGSRVLGFHHSDRGEEAFSLLSKLMSLLSYDFPNVSTVMGKDLTASSWAPFEKAFNVLLELVNAFKAFSGTKETKNKGEDEKLEFVFKDCFSLTMHYSEPAIANVLRSPKGSKVRIHHINDFFDAFSCHFTNIVDKTVIDDNPFKTLGEAKSYILKLRNNVELQQSFFTKIKADGDNFFSSSEEARVRQNLDKLIKLDKPKDQREEDELAFNKVEDLIARYTQLVNSIDRTRSSILSNITGASKSLSKHLTRFSTEEIDKFMES